MKHVLLAFGAGIATGCCLGRLMAAEAARAQGGAGHLPRHHHVRPAGPGAMRDEPREWDRVDEQSDESFPASDPPGNY